MSVDVEEIRREGVNLVLEEGSLCVEPRWFKRSYRRTRSLFLGQVTMRVPATQAQFRTQKGVVATNAKWNRNSAKVGCRYGV